MRQPPEAPSPPSAPARFLYIWAGDKDEREDDFLAVVDVRRGSPTYAQVIATAPVGMSGTLPHHLEYEMPPPGHALFANGHHHEVIFRFDAADPERPRLLGTTPLAPTLRYPHDFARLPNGNLLVSYLRSEGRSSVAQDTVVPGAAGGIAEYTPEGRLLRWASAADSTLPAPMRPYGLAVLPGIDRMVVTGAGMMEDSWADAIQIWRLSDLRRLVSLPAPPARIADGTVIPLGHSLPFVPRLMPDGSVLLNAYGCGFYRITNIAADTPRIENVFTVAVPPDRVPPTDRAGCGIPVVVGRYWVMAVGALNLLLTLDISDPAHPREVARLAADSTFRPHWLAVDPGSNRIVVGAENGGEDRMLMALIDPATGALRWDETFRRDGGQLGISFVRERWPHGASGPAFGHAAVFRQ